MDAYKLRPWTEVVRLHADVESGTTAVATYAIDLGALAVGDPNVPAVYRSAAPFFRATYLTSGVRRLLEEVLGRLAGEEGDRVLQLRSPFGGGKSHTLAALFYAATDRPALNVLPEAGGLPDPGTVRVAVFDGEKFDAVVGKEIAGGIRIRTIWGWLAWRLGGAALLERFSQHDERRVAPGGDEIAALLGDQPTLLLLDEVLKYLERGAGVRVADSTLERQTLDFMQSLSVEVARKRHAVLVYSLQQSSREAMDNVRLLQTLDHITSRVDAKREPVTGDEIMPVLQRRLLASAPPSAAAALTSEQYEEVVTRMRVAHADSVAARRNAEEESIRLRSRLQAAYPFHPTLIDLMKERWASIPDFQRTRGALRFLAACLHALKANGVTGPLLGPGDVPIADGDVRYAFFTEVGQREPFQSVLEADLTGPNARAKRIDDRLSQEHPSLSSARPAMRLATAMLMYSFGGAPREAGQSGEVLPPGVTEQELLASCVGPDLDSITAQATLKELREKCLFLHYDGARYVFKTTPNVTKLVEDEAEGIRADGVRAFLKDEVERRLGGPRGAIAWPETTEKIPDKEALFLVAYLPLEFLELGERQQVARGLEYLTKYGNVPRRYRNGLALAIPNREQLESLRRAARYLLAIEHIQGKKRQLGVTREQDDQLKERQGTEKAGLESAFRALYTSLWLLKSGEGGPEIDPLEAGGRPLQATGIHERMMELLTTVSQRVFGSLAPRRIVELLKLGETIDDGQPPKVGIMTSGVVDAFFGFLGFPRLLDAGVVRKALARGCEEGHFAYSGRGEPELGQIGELKRAYLVKPDRITINRRVSEDEIDLEDGFIILPEGLPAAEPEPGQGPEPGTEPPSPRPEPGPVLPRIGQTPPPSEPSPDSKVVMVLTMTRQQLYDAFKAIGNLADMAGKIKMTLEATKQDGFDSAWLRNAVYEPIEEAGVVVEKLAIT